MANEFKLSRSDTAKSLLLEEKVAAKPPDEVVAAFGGASVIDGYFTFVPADTSSVIVG